MEQVKAVFREANIRQAIPPEKAVADIGLLGGRAVATGNRRVGDIVLPQRIANRDRAWIAADLSAR